jgi:hypothetical protein
MFPTRKQLLQVVAAAVLAATGLCGCAAPSAAAAPVANIEQEKAAAAPVRPDVPMQPPTAQAGSGPARPWNYRCDGGLDFNVHFGDGVATVDGAPGGSQVLLRDAGGATPQQTVYSNERMRVEFGLGEAGREAIVREAGATDGVHCIAQ